MSRITSEITEEMTKKSNIEKFLQQLVKKWTSATDSNTQQTSRARQIKLADKSINALKLASILPHINTSNMCA